MRASPMDDIVCEPFQCSYFIDGRLFLSPKFEQAFRSGSEARHDALVIDAAVDVALLLRRDGVLEPGLGRLELALVRQAVTRWSCHQGEALHLVALRPAI
jgi:hypothetical protein